MIEKIKSQLHENIGKEALIKHNLGRNKFEEYNVTIKELYDYVFLVELDTREKRSFSYSDVLTNTIKINYKGDVYEKL